MLTMTIERTNEHVAHIEAKQDQDKVDWFVIPSRYPFTYAYDYMSTHPDSFGRYVSYSGLYMSRAECAAALHNNPDKEEICKSLADAYLREHEIIWKSNDRE